MNPECQRNQEALAGGDPFANEHVASCQDCGSFRAAVHELEPPPGLIALTMARIEPALAARAALRRSLFWRLSLAGAVSLPVILVLNSAFVWSVYMGLVSGRSRGGPRRRSHRLVPSGDDARGRGGVSPEVPGAP